MGGPNIERAMMLPGLHFNNPYITDVFEVYPEEDPPLVVSAGDPDSVIVVIHNSYIYLLVDAQEIGI